MRISIIQSAYIPWKGLFDLIARSDLHVVFDEAQFAKRHWHNRNRIMAPSGPLWLTIPVRTKSRFDQRISQVEVAERWAGKHWRSIEHAYGRAPFFAVEAERVRALYEAADRLERLSEINALFMDALLDRLNIATPVRRDTDFAAEGVRSDRLLSICKDAGARRYLSGPSARSYLDEDLFRRADVAVDWMDYGPYPTYQQGGPEFDHHVSVLDILFRVGPRARDLVIPPAKAA